MKAGTLRRWLDEYLLEIGRQFRWSYLPPLMVYTAAGISGLTSIVGTFFIKDYLGLSAAFLAGLTFWAGIPWALKMPLGHLVDIIWRWKALLVYLGAALIAGSLGIMYGLIAEREAMAGVMSVNAWFVMASLLAPCGYVLQDVVADAMTVEAVPRQDAQGRPFDEAQEKMMHTTMQTLGRIAIIGGSVLVAVLNVILFAGAEDMSPPQQAAIYADVYLMAFAIPLLSILGVTLGQVTLWRRARALRARGASAEEARELVDQSEPTEPNWWIFGGSLAFVAFTLTMGLAEVPLAQEIIFAGSLAIVSFLIQRILRELPPEAGRALIGTALIIFAFRAMPRPGPGATWFQIDVLGFDQQFISVLTLITSGLTLAGILIFRRLMATRSIAWVVAFLTFAAGILSLPDIGLYYGLADWTASWSGGIVDARFIAIFDTIVESPLGQVAMIPMLAWIARNAPAHLKATFFAVMASFTNLALSAGSLLTKYLNQIFLVTREVTDPESGAVTVPADYSELGWLLIAVTIITLAVPLLVILAVQSSRLHTRD